MNFKFDLQRFANNSPSSDLLEIGAGMYYVALIDDDGVEGVMRPLGNTESAAMNTTPTTVSKYNSMKASRTKYAECDVKLDQTLTITLQEYSPFNVALALYGETGTTTQAAKTVTDLPVTLTPAGYFRIPYLGVTALTIKKIDPTVASVGAATLSTQGGSIASTGTITTGGTYSGTDNADYYIKITAMNTTAGALTGAKFQWKKGSAGTYSADVTIVSGAMTLENGITATFDVGVSGYFELDDIFKFSVVAASATTNLVKGADFDYTLPQLAGGVYYTKDTASILDAGTNCLISYTVPAKTIPTVGGSKSNIKAHLYFVGDPTYGKRKVIDWWKVKLSPTGDMNQIAEDFETFQIKASVLDDDYNHPDNPRFLMQYIPA
jgi:hypothetical protein